MNWPGSIHDRLVVGAIVILVTAIPAFIKAFLAGLRGENLRFPPGKYPSANDR